MTFVIIDSEDQRSVKSVEIAAGAGQWIKARTRDGRKAYGVPSQRKRGVYYLADLNRCSCPDARFGRAVVLCKHVLAVRLHVALVQGQVGEARNGPRPHRSHPSGVE